MTAIDKGKDLNVTTLGPATVRPISFSLLVIIKHMDVRLNNTLDLERFKAQR